MTTRAEPGSTQCHPTLPLGFARGEHHRHPRPRLPPGHGEDRSLPPGTCLKENATAFQARLWVEEAQSSPATTGVRNRVAVSTRNPSRAPPAKAAHRAAQPPQHGFVRPAHPRRAPAEVTAARTLSGRRRRSTPSPAQASSQARCPVMASSPCPSCQDSRCRPLPGTSRRQTVRAASRPAGRSCQRRKFPNHSRTRRNPALARSDRPRNAARSSRQQQRAFVGGSVACLVFGKTPIKPPVNANHRIARNDCGAGALRRRAVSRSTPAPAARGIFAMSVISGRERTG